MKRDRRNELMAGLFVLVAGAVLLAVALWLGGVSFGGRYAYAVAPLDVGDVGIGDGSPVKFSSIVVGRVEDVRPDEDWSTFLFRIRLEADVVIHEDAVIQAIAPALAGVGELYVLDPGSPDSPPATQEHPATLTVGPNPIMRDVERQLGFGPEQRDTLQGALADVGRVLDNLSAITAGVRRIVTVNGVQVDDMIANLTETSANLKAASRDIRRRPWRLLVPPKDADPRVEGIERAAEAFAEGATELDDAIARLEALGRARGEDLAPGDPQLELIRRQIRDAYERFTRLEKALWEEVAQ